MIKYMSADISDTKGASQKAEAIRLRALYRRLAIKGARGFDRLPVDALIALVGPDCAYHLYRGVSGKKNEK